MNLTSYKATLQKTLAQKNLSLWISGGLVLANLLLINKLINTEEKWVFIPQYNTDHHIPMTASKFADDYYIEWAGQLLNSLLNINPESFEWKVKQVLNITAQHHGTLKEKLLADAEKIKREEISTVFYPKQFHVNQAEKWVEVSGQHIAYFGKKSSPVETMKTFRLSWIVANYGLILLKDFSEIKKD